MQKYSSEDIFLNKNLIITYNHFKTAVLIQSPFAEHKKEGIWFPLVMVHFKRSKNPKYICVTIKHKVIYKIYRYKGFSICEAKEISGTRLINGYEEMKKNNTTEFIKNIENDYQEKTTDDLIEKWPLFREWNEKSEKN